MAANTLKTRGNATAKVGAFGDGATSIKAEIVHFHQTIYNGTEQKAAGGRARSTSDTAKTKRKPAEAKSPSPSTPRKKVKSTSKSPKPASDEKMKKPEKKKAGGKKKKTDTAASRGGAAAAAEAGGGGGGADTAPVSESRPAAKKRTSKSKTKPSPDSNEQPVLSRLEKMTNALPSLDSFLALSARLVPHAESVSFNGMELSRAYRAKAESTSLD